MGLGVRCQSSSLTRTKPPSPFRDLPEYRTQDDNIPQDESSRQSNFEQQGQHIPLWVSRRLVQCLSSIEDRITWFCFWSVIISGRASSNAYRAAKPTEEWSVNRNG